MMISFKLPEWKKFLGCVLFAIGSIFITFEKHHFEMEFKVEDIQEISSLDISKVSIDK